MIVLQLVTARQFRGAEVAAAAFSSAMIERGHKVIFVGVRSPSDPPLEVRGAQCFDLELNGYFSLMPAIIRLMRIVRRERPDVLHANGSITLKYLVLVNLFYKHAALGYRNISMVSHWKGRGLKHTIIKWLIHKTNFVTSVGDAAREDFIRTYEYSPEKIFVVRRGIPVPAEVRQKDAARKRLGIDSQARVLLNIGNFSFEKGHDILVNRFAEIHRRTPEAKLILVGDGPLRSAVVAQVRGLGLDSAVTFAGLQPQLADYFASADLLVMTSRIEGVPGVVLEAGACNLPTVALDVGGVSESIRHNETGWVFKPEDQAAFVDMIVALLNDEATRRKVGQAARQWVSEIFDLEKNTDRLIAIFERS